MNLLVSKSFPEMTESWTQYWECKSVVLRALTPDVWGSKLQASGLNERKKEKKKEPNVKFHPVTKKCPLFSNSKGFVQKQQESWYFMFF